MAFIETGAYGGINPGSPSGGGTQAAASVGQNLPKGSTGLGSSMSIRNWCLFYITFIVGILVVTGVLFNGKGKK